MLASRMWLSESLSMVGSGISLLGMVILLAQYDGKQIFSWYGVNLNTVVSILSTASKGCLLLAVDAAVSQWKWIMFSSDRQTLIKFSAIDSASRGPLGSLQLLWRLRGSWTVRFGAIIVLLSLAIDPFSQQLVQLRQDIIYTKDASTIINRAIRYSKGHVYSEPHNNKSFADADFSMQSAIFHALSNQEQDVAQQLNFTCASGNCTWESPIESLSVCSKCANLETLLERYTDLQLLADSLKDVPPLGRIHLISPPANVSVKVVVLPGGDRTADVPAYQLPNGLTINNNRSWSFPHPYTHGSTSSSDSVGTMITAFGTGDRNMTNSFQDVDTLIWATSMLKVRPPPDKSNVTGWPDLPIQALECGLYYYANRYHPSVKESNLGESMENISFARDANSFPDLGNSTVFNSNVSQYHYTKDLRLTTSHSNFSISAEAVHSISSFFQDNFAGPLLEFGSEFYIGHGRLNGFVIAGNGSDWYVPNIMPLLWSRDDIPALFRSIARGMSNAMRDGADDDPEKIVTGSSGALVTSYQVQWGWIAMHLAVFFGGLGFLVATVIGSRKRDSVVVPIWKEDALASLNFGSQLGNVFGPSDSVKEMREVATKQEGRLQTKIRNTDGKHVNDSLETLI